MNSGVASGSASLLEQLVRSLLTEEQTRSALRNALREQGRILRELRATGLPTTTVAHRISAARGIVLPVRDRLRLAERLRKRAWRGTHRPVDLASAHGQVLTVDPRSDRALTPDHEESNMGKLIKRTITEEYLEDEEGDEEEQDEAEDDETEEEVEDEPAPRRRTKASRK
jgi:hypothetical protein